MRFLHELDLGEDALRPLGLAGADTRNVSHLRDDCQSLVCMGFVYEKAIDPQIVEVDGVVLPALGKLFQLLLVLLNLVLDLARGPLLSSRLRAIGFSALTQQVFHLLHLCVDSFRFAFGRDGEHVELGMGNDDGVPFVCSDTTEETFPAEWGIEIPFRHGQNIGGRIGFLELFAPLLNHVVRDYIEVLARDSDSFAIPYRR